MLIVQLLDPSYRTKKRPLVVDRSSVLLLVSQWQFNFQGLFIHFQLRCLKNNDFSRGGVGRDTMGPAGGYYLATTALEEEQGPAVTLTFGHHTTRTHTKEPSLSFPHIILRQSLTHPSLSCHFIRVSFKLSISSQSCLTVVTGVGSSTGSLLRRASSSNCGSPARRLHHTVEKSSRPSTNCNLYLSKS